MPRYNSGFETGNPTTHTRQILTRLKFGRYFEFLSLVGFVDTLRADSILPRITRLITFWSQRNFLNETPTNSFKTAVPIVKAPYQYTHYFLYRYNWSPI